MSSAGLDEVAFDDDTSLAADMHPLANYNNGDRRTIFFSGLSERTTYRDLLSVIKGGRLLSVNIRPERTATVSFLEGAADFLAWVKKNDIYLQSKRVSSYPQEISLKLITNSENSSKSSGPIANSTSTHIHPTKSRAVPLAISSFAVLPKKA
jgi:hypothetical protein